MTRYAILALCLSLVGSTAQAVSPNPQDLLIPSGELLRAKGLIAMLGSAAYQDRESGERELAKMGRLAGPILRDAVHGHQDPEVRLRAARLLTKSEADDLKARTETFLADMDGRYEHSMPGWAAFRKVSGVDYELLGLKLGMNVDSSKQARELFVAMLKSKSATTLLTAIEAGGGDLSKAAGDMRYQMFIEMNPGVFGQMQVSGSQPKHPSLAEFTTLLCAESLLEGKTNARVGPFFIATSTFLMSSNVVGSMQGKGAYSGIFRRILGQWFQKLTDVNELQQSVHMVIQYNIKEAMPAIRRSVTIAGTPIHLRAQAIGALAKLGGKDELPTLRKLVSDETTIQPNRFPNQMGLQVRDVALAMCVIVSGQDVKTYGYEIQQPLNDNNRYHYWTFAFRTPEKRAEALKKWEDWEKAQIKK